MTIFVNGKQKRIKRPPRIDGMDVDEFIRVNADPIWLLESEMYEELYQGERQQERKQAASQPESAFNSEEVEDSDEDLPF